MHDWSDTYHRRRGVAVDAVDAGHQNVLHDWSDADIKYALRSAARECTALSYEIAGLLRFAERSGTSLSTIARDVRMSSATRRWLRQHAGSDAQAHRGLHKIFRFRHEVATVLDACAENPVILAQWERAGHLNSTP